jgi:hypothetical protein
MKKQQAIIVAVFTILALVSLSPVTSAQTTKKKTTAKRVVPLVPVGTDLKVRINDTLSSKSARVGDRFTATVIDPSRFDEARLSGHVSSIQKSGKDDAGKADNEGGIESGGRGKQTVKRTGIGAGVGAVIGGIAGGGKGAAIGMIVGGAGGAGSLAVKGSKELKIESGTDMLVHVTR